MTPRLPILESCDGCGACCMVVARPPFRTDFDESGEEAWERLRRERPDLLAGLLADRRAARAEGRPSYGTPCLWFDPRSARCRHYDLRPQACRAFALGGTDCLDARRRQAIS